MSRKRIERRLVAIADRLAALHAEADVGAAHLLQVSAEADDARLQAVVSETPLARHDHRGAQRSADTLAERQRRVMAKIAELESRQDELLEDLAALTKSIER